MTRRTRTSSSAVWLAPAGGTRTVSWRAGVLWLAPLLWLGCIRPVADQPAEDDHSHAGGGVVTRWTDALELFVEYPPHVRDAASDPWAIHLTWLDDWKPVEAGRLTLLLRGPGGRSEEIVLDTPSRPGVFTAAPTLTASGTWRADMTLITEDGEYSVPVGPLEVFDSEDALPHDVEVPPPGLIAFLKEQQWSMPFAVAPGGRAPDPPGPSQRPARLWPLPARWHTSRSRWRGSFWRAGRW